MYRDRRDEEGDGREGSDLTLGDENVVRGDDSCETKHVKGPYIKLMK